jgi:hypothetical protein
MFTGSEVIGAIEGCTLGVCKGKYSIIISDVPTVYKNGAGEPYYLAEGRVGGVPLESTQMVPESVKKDPYRENNLNWLKVKVFGTSMIDSVDIQVGCATPSC